jgi:hypothetical protein
VKNDSSVPPADASAIQAVTPSDIFSWPRLDVRLTQSSERTGIENNWFALTGRVVALKVETDGDLHIALVDATGGKPGIVVVEVPAKKQWCEIRTMFLVSHARDSLFTLALLGNSRSTERRSSLLSAKRTSMLVMPQRSIQSVRMTLFIGRKRTGLWWNARKILN